MTDGTQPDGRRCRPFILGSTIGITVETRARLRHRIEWHLIARQKRSNHAPALVPDVSYMPVSVLDT